MVKMMNKKEFINKLQNETGYNEERCIIINDVLENYFLIGRNNRKKAIFDLKEKLSIEEKEAEKIYDICINIISDGIKDKIKHPFG